MMICNIVIGTAYTPLKPMSIFGPISVSTREVSHLPSWRKRICTAHQTHKRCSCCTRFEAPGTSFYLRYCAAHVIFPIYT